MLFSKVKMALRVNGDALDAEIKDIISAALIDLATAGVIYCDDNPCSLIEQAVVCFAKARFGFEDVTMADRFWKSYEAHKTQLAIVVNADDSCAAPVVKKPVDTIDLSKLETDEVFTVKCGDEVYTYGFKKVDGGYDLVMPDGNRKVFIDTVDEDAGGGTDEEDESKSDV